MLGTAAQKISGRMMSAGGRLRRVLTRISQPPPSRRPIYVRLLGLLFCVAVTATLVQAGSLFLDDYISVNRTLAGKARHYELFWRRQVELARAGAASGFAAPGVGPMSKDVADPGEAETSWKFARGGALSAELAGIVAAENEIRRMIEEGTPAAGWRPLAEGLAVSYARISGLLQRELDIRRSTVLLLQIAGLLFLFFCVARIALDMRRALVDRLDRIVARLPEYCAPDPPSPEIDEIARLERRAAGLTSQLQGLAAEAASSSEAGGHLRRMVGAQEFLFRFVELINASALNEAMLRTVLNALERALDADNAAIVYVGEESAIADGRSIYSSREPAPLTDDIMSELRRSGSSTFVATGAGDRRAHVVAVAFVEPSGETGALLIETDAGRLPDAAGMKTLCVAAGLLSITAKFQNHDREGRRVAVLEERAAIARELHDSLAQSLSFMKIQLARLRSGKNAGAVERQAVIGELQAGLDIAYRELRELLATFRAHMDVRGLRYALQSAIDEFSQRSSLSISLDNRLEAGQLTVNEEFHVLQIVRETLSNIARHANAEHAFIALSTAPDGSALIVIDDDGIGYEPAADGRDHHGHAIMEERACSLGGGIEVGPRPQGGTRVKLTFTPKEAQ